ncbi:TonB-dependent receptor [Pedobacter duraquae]|uniref:Carboxypeptidase family protein n=1 Tax=Pedobacter duraquae TaxID=425511 RepID=A0A4R6IJB3_9SPHI|nr:TonB-dependent receptor [Pedobacter duraquae]TDO22073.1 carboxypeptidase family protein [Pedobacter duraquae]
MRVYLILLFNLFLAGSVTGQVNNRINGLVKDSLKRPIPNAAIKVIAGEDTLHASTDDRGKFNLSGISTIRITLEINAFGYLPYTRELIYDLGQRTISLPLLSLERDAHTLKEVVIKAQVIPIRLMKDTIEYNAAAFAVRENDRVDELLRLMPGMTIDREGRALNMGKVMTKLRINGEDFFTSNVKDFISQLPADMIAKVQVINDYGDEANFTGVKTGEPQKMLNLVTKPGRGKGNFGNTSINGGSNERYGLQTNGNIWREKKQIGVKANVISTNNAAGINRNIATGINYRDKISEGLTTSLGYTYDNNKNNSKQLDYIETVNPLGIIRTTNANDRLTTSDKHNLNWSLQSVGKLSYFQASVVGSFLNSNSNSDATSRQTGVILQDLANRNATKLYTPNFSGNLAYAYRLNKPGRNLSVGFTAKNGINNTDEDLLSKIVYYNDRIPVKDSVLNRLVDTRNRSRNISATVRFSEPLGGKVDSAKTKSLDVYYTFDMEENANDLLTRVNTMYRVGRVVDSLSTMYTSRFTAHLLGASYRFASESVSYNLGITAQPNILTVRNEQPRNTISHVGFNVAPVANVSYILTEKSSLSLVYTGNNVAPNFTQLQPVPNTRNLQNVIVGNPNLRSTFTHTAGLSYQKTDLKTGAALMLGVNANVIKDQVVTNLILVTDTLNSLKQETNFLNANGAYSFETLYSWSQPFVENTYNLEFRGNVGFANTVSYSDYILNQNKGFNFSQAVLLRMNKKKLIMTGDASYNYYSNRYSLAIGELKDIQVYEFNLSMKTFLGKRYAMGFDALKRINIGYSIEAKNPLLINLSLEKSFLKRDQGTIKLQAYDILNQGNYLIRSVSDNSIIDSKNNQITRYLQLSLNINLQQFGG